MRAAVAVLLFVVLIAPAVAGQTTCTRPPDVSWFTWGGLGCTTGACRLGADLTFAIGYTVPQDCDLYTWDFGDGTSTTVTSATATHKYTSGAAAYTVRLTAHNSYGSTVMAGPVLVANGVVSFYDRSGSALEGETMRFGITRSNPAGTTSVRYSTADDTAKAGVNYTATSGTATFADGETTKVIYVPLLHDPLYQPHLAFKVLLSNPTNDFLLARSYAPYTVNIIDTDPPPSVGFEYGAYTIPENGGPVTINIVRSGDLTSTVHATYKLSTTEASWSGLQPTSGTLTFGPNETVKSFAVTPINDDVLTFHPTAEVDLTSEDAKVTVAYTGLAVKDDDPPPSLTVSDISVSEGDHGQTQATFTAKLSYPLPTGSTVVYFATENDSAIAGSDYVAINEGVSFSAGETSHTFSVPILGDTLVEPNETFRVKASICCTTPPLTLSRPYATCTILNDDVGIDPADLRVARGDTGRITIQLAQPASSPATISVTSSSSAVASVPAVITVAAGVQTIGVEVTGLSVGGSTIRAVLPPQFGGAALLAHVTVYAPVIIGVSPASLHLPTGGTATVSLSLRPGMTEPVAVQIDTSSAGAVEVPTTATIPASGSTTIRVKALKAQAVAVNFTLIGNYGGATASLPVDITEASANPFITAIAPAAGATAGGTSVSISGGNFAAPCTVLFGGVPATNVVAGMTTITAMTPSHMAGIVDVTAVCATQPPFTFPNSFTYTAIAPTLSAVAPPFGSTAGGTLVRLTGAALPSGCGVWFDDAPGHAVTLESPMSLFAVAPPHKAAIVDVTLRCGDDMARLADAYAFTAAVDPAASVLSVDPQSAVPGESVTVTGTGFRPNDAFTFGDVPAAVLSTTPNVHVVRVPDAPAGKTALVLTDANARVTTGPMFDVLEPVTPQIRSITPVSGAAGSEVVLTGEGFRPPYTFGLGDKPLTLVSLAFDRAVVRVPKSFEAGTGQFAVLNAQRQIASAGPQFEVTSSGPSIESVTPECATTDALLTVTIRGSGFVNGATVTADANAATAVTVDDGSTIHATLPAGTVGAVTLTVRNGDGATATLTNAIRYVSPYDPDGGCAGRARGARH